MSNISTGRFEGRYFNEKSTRARKVSVSLSMDEMVIIPEEAPEERIYWKTNAVDHISKEKNKIILKQKSEYKMQILEIPDLHFYIELKSRNPELPEIKSPNNAYLYVLLGIFLSIAGVVALAYFFLFPFLVNYTVEIFPRSTEVQIGKTIHANYLKGQKIDEKKTILINRFYKQLSVDSGYNVNITVIESDIKNAFALPGGEIIVYSGLISKMGSYPELVALLGHEAGHVYSRHSLRLLVKNLSLGILINLVLQDFASISGYMISKGMELEQLSYSREAEKEADEFSFKILKRNHIPPKGIVDLFNKLNETSENGSVPEFMMTHPKLENRISSINKIIMEDPYPVQMNDSLLFYWNGIKQSANFQW